MKQTFKLYNGQVELIYDPEARYRYSVDGAPVRGVTTLLGNVLDKAGLRLWPLNELSKLLFGSTWDDVSKEYQYDPQKALIKPEKAYSEYELNNLFVQGYSKHKEKRDKAADVGSQVHEAIEAYMAGKNPPVGEKAWKPYTNFVRWYKAGGYGNQLSEAPVYSRKHKYAGRFDALLEKDGKTILMDAKTTEPSPSGVRVAGKYTGIYPEMLLQLGAYSLALTEETGARPGDLMIVNVSKNGQIAVLKASELGLSVEDCEQAFLMGVELHNWLSKIKKVKVGMPLPEGEEDEQTKK